ncbi:4448_t:CDS:2, partial [Gigaspora rosea]
MATLIDDKLYFFGGSRPIPMTSPVWNLTHQYNLSDEVFYLDLSSSFTVDLLPFKDLSDTSRMPFGCEKGTTVKGNGGIRVFLVGGVQQNMVTSGYNTTNSILWVYNVNSQEWGLSQTVGTQLPRRRSTATIIDQSGVIYIFGGRVELDMGSNVFTIFDDFFTFNTLSLTWMNLSSTNPPYKRSHSTATLMPDGTIIYIGGVTQEAPGQNSTRILMNEINVFDTKKLTWSMKYANNHDPTINIDPRVGHTAVLGGTQSYGLNQTTAYPIFVLLDVKSEPFQYLSPQTSGSPK